MAYGFVQQSGGHIEIDSAPGEGATVRIYLPRIDQPEAETGAPASRLRGGSETILVVEDDQRCAPASCAMLAGWATACCSAGDAEQALRRCRSGVPVDLLFTDVVMPGPVRAPRWCAQRRRCGPDWPCCTPRAIPGTRCCMPAPAARRCC